MNVTMLRRRLPVLYLSLMVLAFAAKPARALVHSVSDFRLDFSGAAADTFRLDYGWGDSLLLDAKAFQYRSVLTRNLSDSLYGNGLAGASAVASATGRFAFKVAYLSWITPHTPGNAPPGDAPRANIVVRKIQLSPDTAVVEDTSSVIAGQENATDNFSPHKFTYNVPGSPPPPSYLGFAGEGTKYAAYWGSQSPGGPIRRTSHKEASVGGSPNAWGAYVTPAAPVTAGGYGKVSSGLVPGSGGSKTIVAYETINTFPSGSFEVRWEDIDSVLSTASATIARPVFPEDFAVAADSSGNSLVLWRENTNLYGVGYDGTHAQVMAPTLLQAGIFTQDSVTHWYRPYAVASMSRGNFIIAYARAGTVAGNPVNVIYYRTLALPVAPQAYSLGAEKNLTAATDYCMFPDLSMAVNRVVLGWFQRTATPGAHRFMGSIFQRAGAADIDTSAATRVDLDFAKEDIGFSGVGGRWYRWHWLKTASVSMDDKGNILAAYDNGYNAKVALIRNTPIYYDSAVFVSKIFQIANPSIPSFTFNPAVDSVDFLSLTVNDTTHVGLRLAVSPTNTFAGAGSAYLPLAAHKLAAAGYYRYRIDLHTTLPASLTTPKVKNLDLSYNVKPRLPGIDSIKAGNSPQTAFNPAVVYPLLPRKDSLRLVCSGFDLDDVSLEFRLSLGTTLLKSVAGVRTSAGNFKAVLTVMPPDTLLNPLPLTITVVDDRGWNSQPFTVNFAYKNVVPTQSIKVIQRQGRDVSRVYQPAGGVTDTLSPGSGNIIVAQAGDTLTVKAAYADGNDDSVLTSWRKNGGAPVQKKAATRDTLTFQFPVDTIPPLVDTLILGVGDKDTTVTFKILVRSNRMPAVDSLFHSAYKALDSTWRTGPFDRLNGPADTGLLVPAGLPSMVQAVTSDPDVPLGDSVRIRWTSWKPAAGCARGDLSCYQSTDSALGAIFTHTFVLQEQYLTVRVTDLSGAFRERKVWLEYPVVDTGGATGLSAAMQTLTGDIDFILGANAHEKSVTAEVASQGTAPLQILSVATRNDDRKWLDLRLKWLDGAPPRPDSLLFAGRTDANAITAGAVSIAPGANIAFVFRFFSDSLRGDSVLTDTLIVQTNDFANPLLRIPFRIVYNDLPVVRLGVPGSKGAGASNGFNTAGLPAFVPARSTLAFAFTETVKVKNPAQTFRIYSYLDSLKNPGGYHLIAGDFDYRRKQAGLPKVSAAGDSLADSIVFTPKYDRASDSLKVKPAPGYFIYRDVLHIAMSNAITDKAGNGLDLRLDRSPHAPGTLDTVFQALVDTGYFTVVSTQPASGQTNWDPDQPVRIRFNRRLAQRPPAGNDTLTLLNLKTLKGDSNLSIRVTSVFQGDRHFSFQFLSLDNGDSTLVFKTRPRFPAMDTVTVALSGGILDTSGLSLDGNGNKFPDWIYAPGDTVDQFRFTFEVRDQDFYVYPNPYRFSDARHRDKGNITFKNINTLDGFVTGQEVILRIHTMTGDLIYNSHDAGTARSGFRTTNFTSLDWDMKNTSGTTVGTGVYIFTLITGHDKLMRKGKVAVIR